jgi:hypothetical protein
MTENLFSYGTLQDAPIQLKTFGRILEGHPDILIGYRITLVKIKDEAVVALTGMTHYNNITYTGNPADDINGTLFIITDAELKQSDEYEALDDYERIRLQLKSGKTA